MRRPSSSPGVTSVAAQLGSVAALPLVDELADPFVERRADSESVASPSISADPLRAGLSRLVSRARKGSVSPCP